MFSDESSKQAEIARLSADLRNAKIELLSAQCAADRLRLQYSVQDIISFGERHALKGAIASAAACTLAAVTMFVVILTAVAWPTSPMAMTSFALASRIGCASRNAASSPPT